MTWDHDDYTLALSKNSGDLLNVSQKDFESYLKHHNVTPEALNDMFQNVREWLRKEPHLPADKMKDRQIIGLLLFRGFSVERVKRAIDDYFTARVKAPDFLCERDPLDLMQAQYLKRGYTIVMPKKTPEGERVGIFRIIPDEKNSIPTILKITSMVADYLIWNDVAMGDRWIFDLENISLHEVTQLTPVLIANVIFIITACLGAKLKSIHVINMPSIAAVAVNLFKMMMKTKLTERVFVSNKNEILKIFPTECLPLELGGEGESYQDIADNWTKELQSDSWRQFFLEHNSAVTDESKRIGLNYNHDLFGVDGSFRKLHLD